MPGCPLTGHVTLETEGQGTFCLNQNREVWSNGTQELPFFACGSGITMQQTMQQMRCNCQASVVRNVVPHARLTARSGSSTQVR